VPQGKALGTDFSLFETYPKASAAFALAALPAGADPTSVISEMKKILKNYAINGVPVDLVEAAQKGEVASAEFARNSSRIWRHSGRRLLPLRADNRRTRMWKP